MPESTKQPSSSQTCHVFWPSDYPLDSTGYLIGWQIDKVFCVATLVENYSLTSLHRSDRDLDGSLDHPHNARLLGQLNPPANSSSSPPQSDREWIAIKYQPEGILKIKNPQEEDEEESIVMIYDRPSIRKHHFLSLRPLLKPSLVVSQNNQPSSSSTSASAQRNGNKSLADKIKLFDQLYPHLAMSPSHDNSHPREMSTIIKFINSSEEIHNRFHKKNKSKDPGRKKTIKKPSQQQQEGKEDHESIEALPNQLDLILGLSTFLQQFNVRLVEISSWPSRYRKITREEDADLSGRRAEYVMLFNTLWLIANDIIFGRTSGQILMENSDLLAAWLEYHLQTYTVMLVKKALHWTNSYPVGLKLNDQLGQAFCLCSNMAVDFWHIYVLKHAYLILPKMIWTVGFVSLFGNTFALAIASDFLTIATFHLWIIYRLFTFIFDCQLRFLSVLFNIFRGRKYNVLRKRNEPATYQLDQLILGTILFTLAIFLFPTILAFYILTSTTRVLIVWVHGIIGTGLSLLNHFPLFVLMLRLKDPARLPSGVCFIPLHDHGPAKFKLQNVPVGLSWIFSDYISLWANLTSHYSPRLLLYHLCSGKPIAPLTTRAAAYKRP
ncbi:phosphatidylinositol N-acetylglucosaminyltransferase subunit gpi1 [Puccinia graminis f. sp. tritici]|uniref:Phosphatidylinositol N-acetylglucosaminyltransferase subunit gpi1 n=1 Tax=Puccinia graminis f. sp. tritici TaxID=56615 RepID=A0A5B0MN52_PUCGR|nr:phosphatidylinositol N-acetylglucosaminyltransferase subunit gpi1 [Puccinia graminis f. sp. tritici]